MEYRDSQGRSRRARVGAALAAGVMLLPAAPTTGASCRTRQLTNAPDARNGEPLISKDSKRVVFFSQKLDRKEFVGDLMLIEVESGVITPIATIPEPDTVHFAMNRDANRVVFEEYRRDDPAPFVTKHLVLYDRGLTSDLPTPPDCDISSQALDGAGTLLTCRSREHQTAGNRYGSDEIFLYDLASGTVRQLTHTTQPSYFSRPVISADGTRVAYEQEGVIRVVDVQSLTDVEVCATDNAYETLAMNADGTRFAYFTDVNRNDDDVTRLLLCDTTTKTPTQLAEFQPGDYDSLDTLDVSATGERVVIEGTGDPLGKNPDGSFEVFLSDAGRGLTQITEGESDSSNSYTSISGDGRRIAYHSYKEDCPEPDCDYDFEIFLAECDVEGDLCGDSDGNRTITVTDGVNVLREAAGLSSTCTLARCDVDGNGSVSVTDGVNVLRRGAGLPVELHCSERQ